MLCVEASGDVIQPDISLINKYLLGILGNEASSQQADGHIEECWSDPRCLGKYVGRELFIMTLGFVLLFVVLVWFLLVLCPFSFCKKKLSVTNTFAERERERD